MTGRQIIHWRLIHLDVAAGHHAGADVLVNQVSTNRRPVPPSGLKTLPRQVDSVALLVNLFLPVEGKMNYASTFPHHRSAASKPGAGEAGDPTTVPAIAAITGTPSGLVLGTYLRRIASTRRLRNRPGS